MNKFLQQIRQLVTVLAVIGALMAPLAIASSASADCTGAAGGADIQSCLTTGACLGTTSSTCTAASDPNGSVNRIITTVINIFSLVVGVVAVIMIIIGGFRYITSGGDSGKVSGAKDSILFAIVGLVIVALSQIIVHFVLTRVAPTS